mmetsp:Transcript_18464/g.30674  ORF Transcript_18464/g.30674 Transcript_18464/m.30674 type:complete len:134 (-) Transcript_18464:2964-3365(-)
MCRLAAAVPVPVPVDVALDVAVAVALDMDVAVGKAIGKMLGAVLRLPWWRRLCWCGCSVVLTHRTKTLPWQCNGGTAGLATDTGRHHRCGSVTRVTHRRQPCASCQSGMPARFAYSSQWQPTVSIAPGTPWRP